MLWSGCWSAIAVALVPETQVQGNLLAPERDWQRDKRLMSAIDALNTRFGRGTISFAAEGLQQPWQMKAARRSPRFTTRWDELAIARNLDLVGIDAHCSQALGQALGFLQDLCFSYLCSIGPLFFLVSPLFFLNCGFLRDGHYLPIGGEKA